MRQTWILWLLIKNAPPTNQVRLLLFITIHEWDFYIYILPRHKHFSRLPVTFHTQNTIHLSAWNVNVESNKNRECNWTSESNIRKKNYEIYQNSKRKKKKAVSQTTVVSSHRPVFSRITQRILQSYREHWNLSPKYSVSSLVFLRVHGFD